MGKGGLLEELGLDPSKAGGVLAPLQGRLDGLNARLDATRGNLSAASLKAAEAAAVEAAAKLEAGDSEAAGERLDALEQEVSFLETQAVPLMRKEQYERIAALYGRAGELSGAGDEIERAVALLKSASAEIEADRTLAAVDLVIQADQLIDRVEERDRMAVGVLQQALQKGRDRAKALPADIPGLDVVARHLDAADKALKARDLDTVEIHFAAATQELDKLEALDSGAVASARLDAAVDAVSKTVPGVERLLAPRIDAARAALKDSQEDAFNSEMVKIEELLDAALPEVDREQKRLDALKKRIESAQGDTTDAVAAFKAAKGALKQYELAVVDAKVADAELALHVAENPSTPDEMKAALERWAEAAERIEALAPFDAKIEADTAKDMDAARTVLDASAADKVDAPLKAVEARLDAGEARVRKARLARIDMLAKRLKAETALGSDLSKADAHLKAAKSAAGQAKFHDAKVETDAAHALILAAQDGRKIDIAAQIRKDWVKARDAYKKDLEAIAAKVAQDDTPESKLLAKMGLTAWTEEAKKAVDRAIDRLGEVPAGPSGQVARLTAVATFRDAATTLVQHPAAKILESNPWGVGFDTKAMAAALAKLEKRTLEA